MKKNIPDLSIFDNADEETLRMLSDIRLAGESEKQRILAMSLRKYDQRTGAELLTEPEDSVDGVEAYRRPKWHITLSAAAAVLALGIGVLAAASLLKHSETVPPVDPLITTQTTDPTAPSDAPVILVPGTDTAPAGTHTDTASAAAGTDTGTAASAVPGTVTSAAAEAVTTDAAPAPGFYPLEMHSDERKFYTKEQAEAVISAGAADYAANGPRLIDRDYYISKIHAASGYDDLNTGEIKSYIYHMMLNSTDYYYSAAGTVTVGLEFPDDPSQAPQLYRHDFLTDMRTDRSTVSHEIDHIFAEGKGYSFNEGDYNLFGAYYASTGITNLTVTNTHNTRSSSSGFGYYIGGGETHYDMPVIHNVSDNDRRFLTPVESDPSQTGDGYIIGSAATRAGSADQGLYPVDSALRYLSDFSKWDITGTQELCGFECVKVELDDSDTHGTYHHTICISIRYGIALSHITDSTYTSASGDIVSDRTVFRFDSLTLDQEYFNVSGSPALYGGLDGAASLRELPDRILITNSRGVSGYILRDELLAYDPPRDHEEIDPGLDVPQTVKTIPLNLYDVDTGSVIDTFEVQTNIPEQVLN